MQVFFEGKLNYRTLQGNLEKTQGAELKHQNHQSQEQAQQGQQGHPHEPALQTLVRLG